MKWKYVLLKMLEAENESNGKKLWRELWTNLSLPNDSRRGRKLEAVKWKDAVESCIWDINTLLAWFSFIFAATYKTTRGSSKYDWSFGKDEHPIQCNEIWSSFAKLRCFAAWAWPHNHDFKNGPNTGAFILFTFSHITFNLCCLWQWFSKKIVLWHFGLFRWLDLELMEV